MKRFALIALPALVLAACGADGTIKSPAAMTAAERCANAEVTLALMEANGVGEATLERARVNVALLCAEPA